MDLTAAGPVSSAVRSLCADFNGFGLDLHRGLPSGGNTFISPLSIGAALAALLQGARGQTATELARVLRLEGTAEDTARAMAELRGILTPRKTVEEAWNDETEEFETTVRETFRLSLVLCSQSLFRFADLGDDGLCRGGPDKGCGVIVSAIDVVVDRLD